MIAKIVGVDLKAEVKLFKQSIHTNNATLQDIALQDFPSVAATMPVLN